MIEGQIHETTAKAIAHGILAAIESGHTIIVEHRNGEQSTYIEVVFQQVQPYQGMVFLGDKRITDQQREAAWRGDSSETDA